jgi:glycosyltransferase involved in cell wall biosynthesis
MPRVSVVLPSYNHERFVARALDSVLAQTYHDLEIVITDDGSTDNSVEVLRAYQEKDSRIKLFVNRVNYETHSVNNCIRHSSGEYLAMLSSDDEFSPAKLATQVSFLDDHPDVAAVFTDARIVNEHGHDLADPTHFYSTIFTQPNRSRHEWLHHFFFKGNCLCHPSVLIRRSVYETLGLYNPLLAALDDLEMWVRLCLHHQIHVLPEKLINFRVLDGQANFSGDKPENFRRGQYEWIKILDHFQTPDALAQLHLIFPEVAAEVLHECDAVRRHVLAILALQAGHLAHKFWGIDLLYDLLGDPETKRQLAHRIGIAAEGEFVRLNGQLNPFTIEQRPAAQVFWPVAGAYSEMNSRSVYYPRSEWTAVRIPVPAWDTATPLRVDPCNFACVVKVADVKILSRTDGRCLWKPDLRKEADAIRLSGTAAWLSDQDTLSILSTGNDPQIYLCGMPQLPDLPLDLQIWLKVDPDLDGVEKQVQTLRAALAEGDGQRQGLEAQVHTLQAALAEGDGQRQSLEAQVHTLQAALAEGDGQRQGLEAQVHTLQTALAEGDRLMQVFLNSRSWRYTRPLRALRRILDRA